MIYDVIMIFIAVGTMGGLFWNVLMSKTMTNLGHLGVYKGDCSLGIYVLVINYLLRRSIKEIAIFWKVL